MPREEELRELIKLLAKDLNGGFQASTPQALARLNTLCRQFRVRREVNDLRLLREQLGRAIARH